MPNPSTWSASTLPRAGTKAPPTTSTAPWIAPSTTASSTRCSPPKPPRAKEWEKLDYFEGCLPIEVLARRGRDTLRFGPMKPVGLRDPRTGKTPWAVVQLRKENLRADSYNLVGFQNHLKLGEQARVLRLIPGLENARFLRYGQIHRNTYICAPALLDECLRLKVEQRDSLLFAGQLSGVEGYTESIATGLLAGLYAASFARGEEPAPDSARHRARLAGPLHHARRPQRLPARQHHLRPAGAARRRDCAKKSATRKSAIASSASARWPPSTRGGQTPVMPRLHICPISRLPSVG